VERPSRMFGEPGQHLRMFMGGIVVEDGVDPGADFSSTPYTITFWSEVAPTIH
jgi:hypothetical protein